MSTKPKESESTEPKNIHIEDPLVHIQRHKGTRARYELYVHHAELRSWLQECEILIPNEKDKPMKRLGKKMLFYSLEFGPFLQALCGYLNRAREENSIEGVAALMESLEKKKLELWNLVKVEESPWEDIYKKLTKLVKTKIYDDFGGARA
jgi:hypothetical protein